MQMRSLVARFGRNQAANLASMSLVVAVGCAGADAGSVAPASPAREPQWISGEVMGVDRIPIDQYNDSTVHLVVTTEAPEPVHLELGPGWYVQEQGLAFQPEQHIEYRGTPNATGGVTVYEVRQGASRVQLRNDSGEPTWQPRAKP
jgi:hypothetical protein